MSKKSAGLLLFREVSGRLEVLLVHPGGPFWAKKDEGVWSIPKGEFEDKEPPLEAAKREFEEETGFTPDGEMIPLKPLLQSSGKLVYAWAMKRDVDPAHNFEPPATDDEVHAAAPQFVRKISGFAKPSTVNEEAFNRAVAEVAKASCKLLGSLVTAASPRNREVEAAKARVLAVHRFGS